MSNYSLSKVKLVVGGAPVLGGFADDSEVITTEPVDPRVEVVQGASGFVAFCSTGKTLVKATVKLLQTSIYNGVLSAVHLLQVDNGASPFLLIDTNGVTVVSGDCMIEGMPKAGYGAKAGTREWTVLIDADIFLEGGTQT